MTPAYSRVWNWARWSNNCDPNIGYHPIAMGFEYMVHETSDMDGWGDTSKEAFLPPVDIPDAILVGDYIRTLPEDHKRTLKVAFIFYPPDPKRTEARRQLKREDIDTAIRLLADRLPEKKYLRIS